MRTPVTATVAIAVMGSLLGSACARRMVVAPETVARLNDDDWHVQQRRPKLARPPEGEGAAPADVAEGPAAPPAPLSPWVKLAPPALGTPRDKYGIPVGLYDHDPMLLSYRQIAEARALSHRQAGGGLVAMGTLFAALNTTLIVMAAQNAQNHPDRSGSADQMYFWGVLGGVLSVGMIAGGIAELLTSTDARALQRYARETYDLPSP